MRTRYFRWPFASGLCASLLAVLSGVVGGGGCGQSNAPAAILAIHINPDPVRAGERAQASVTVGFPRAGMKFRWFAAEGSFLVSETGTNSAVYVAPSLIQSSKRSLPVRVWVQIISPGEPSRIAETVISVVAEPTQSDRNLEPAVVGELEITEIPHYDEIGGPDKREQIAGKVTGFDPQEHRILIYTKTDDWWVQPRADDPLLRFGSDGKWNADIFLGTEYSVFVVKRTFQPPARTPFLPRIGDDVLKVVRVKGRKLVR